MTLHINTSDLTQTTFKLLRGKKVVAEYTQEMEPHSTHTTLEHVEKFITQQGWTMHPKPEQISKVQLYTKEGSPTGLRLGASIGQALALAWDIPFSPTNTKL